MPTDLIQTNYEQCEAIAGRFARQAEQVAQLQSQLQRVLEPLRQGGWEGEAAQAFFAEMEQVALPATARLQAALVEAGRVTLKINEIMRRAEEEAAAPFRGAGHSDGAAVSPAPNETPGGAAVTPQPRIYIVNGINSEGNVPGARDLNGNIIKGDDQSVALELLLENNGYDPDQVTSTGAIFLGAKGTHLTGTAMTGTNFGGWLSPVDWLTGQAAGVVNTMSNTGAEVINTATGILAGGVNTLVGSKEVLDEYLAGEHGRYTERVYNEIANDLQKNPLAPGQTIILMGHSGGGAVVANLAGKVEKNSNYDVSGIVTMGSPVANYDEAGRYAELITDVRHTNDRIAAPLGTPMIRSGESRVSIPLAFEALANGAPPIRTALGVIAIEGAGRHIGDQPNVATVMLDRPAGSFLEPHGSYMHDDEKRPGQANVSMDMLRQLNSLYPSLNLQIPSYNL
ncbi:MAG: hypothetical protein Kow0031_31120 [Anaerolineae bacterium]